GMVSPMHLQDTSSENTETIELQDGRIFEMASLQAQTDGQYIGRVHSYRDVTQQKQVEKQLRIAATIFDSRLGMIITDANETIIMVNQAFTNLTGYTQKDALGRSLFHINSDLENEGIYESVWKHVDSAGSWEGEINGLHKNGEFSPMYCTICAVKDSDDIITNYVATISDLTERKKAEAAEASSRAKSEFLANMSHEIRTPMNGVIGMVDILMHSKLDNTQLRLVQTIQDSSLSLLNILNDILDFSKIEAGKLDIEFRPTFLRGLLEGVVEHYFQIANTKAFQLHFFLSPELPHWISTDSGRLRQILLNLLGNAVKFKKEGHSGRIALHVEPARLDGGQPTARFRVLDNGIGMSQETLSKLFQPFTQADESSSRKFGGTGLGLSICQQLVRLMGGQIQAKSVLGEGTEFIVELPLTEAAPESSRVPEPSLSGVQVVAVARDPANIEILRAYCRAAGASVLTADSLTSAIKQLPEIQLQCPETVLLLDTGVDSGMRAGIPDNMRIAQLVRRGNSGSVAGAIPIYSNPVLYGDLVRGIALACGRMNTESVALQSERRKERRVGVPTVEAALANGQLILLAEDNETNREVMCEQLRLLGYMAETANNGEMALSMWRTGKYALLLTDCHMPVMDGFELVRRVRKEEAPGVHYPIIAVTANAMRGEKERCMAHGMDGYISKPLRLSELGAMLSRWLPLPHTEAGNAIEAQPVENPAGPPPAATIPGKVELTVWDETMLTKMVGDNPVMHHRLLEKFMTNSQKQADEIRSAIEGNDPLTAGNIAHALKSAARTVGAMKLGELCKEMELAGKNGELATLKALVPPFQDQLAAVAACMHSKLTRHTEHKVEQS
ncbi:MAG: ATP-binding protein, partial [Gallionellaceae bacterium]|nr:ATP-binding protein [Gallionellaceae bacterium]